MWYHIKHTLGFAYMSITSIVGLMLTSVQLFAIYNEEWAGMKFDIKILGLGLLLIGAFFFGLKFCNKD